MNLEIQIAEKDLEILKKEREILQLKLDKLKLDKLKFNGNNDIIQQWINEDIVECDDPVSFNTLYQTFIAWCENEGKKHKIKMVEKRDIKRALEDKQTKGTYGLHYGKKASDKAPNGYPKYSKFNFCSKDDLDD